MQLQLSESSLDLAKELLDNDMSDDDILVDSSSEKSVIVEYSLPPKPEPSNLSQQIRMMELEEQLKKAHHEKQMAEVRYRNEIQG